MSFRVRSYNRDFLVAWNERLCTPVTDGQFDKAVIAYLKVYQAGEITYVPRNLYEPEKLYEGLQWFSPEHSNFVDFKDPGVQAGLRFSFKCFAKPHGQGTLKPVRLDGPLDEVFKLLDIKGDKSPGLTAYGMTKLEAFPIAMRKVVEFAEDKRNPDPCLATTRTQEEKPGRLVWAYPLMMTILEGVIARPLLDYFKANLNTPMAFGMRSSYIGMQMRNAVAHNCHYVSMDASRFDSTIQAGVIKHAFNCLRTWFDLSDEVGFGWKVGDIFDIVEDYFIHTPIVMPSPEGPKLYTGKRHGVPSGSYFTQVVDSIANVAMIGTLDFLFKLGIRTSEIFVLGDDMLFFSKKKPNLDAYAQALSSRYFMVINSKKSESGSANGPIKFLGRVWINGLPTREFSQVKQRAVSFERYRDYGDDVFGGASAVVASYGLTSFITGIPDRFNMYQRATAQHIRKNSTSGLTEYLSAEGLLSQQITPKLF